MRYLKTLTFILVFAAAHTTMAAGVFYETGTIKSVDMSGNTFTVKFDGSGITKTYSFPGTVNYIDKGMLHHDKSLIQPGQAAKLKFMNTGMQASPEKTVSGVVIKFDTGTGKGVLRSAMTNKLIHFRLATDLMKNRVDMPAAGTEVELTYIINEGSVASLD